MKNDNASVVSAPAYVESSYWCFLFYDSTATSCGAPLAWSLLPRPSWDDDNSTKHRQLHIIGGGGLVYPALIAMSNVLLVPNIDFIFTEPCSAGTMLWAQVMDFDRRRCTLIGGLTIHGFDTYSHRHPDTVFKMIAEDVVMLDRFGVCPSFIYTWAKSLTSILAVYRDLNCVNIGLALEVYLHFSAEEAIERYPNVDGADFHSMMENTYAKRLSL